ncbi:MAG: hypothetical protein ACOX24_05545 [Christensenellales bacterium]|jgi:hypothetical protein|nr:hypothetical protein [Clostridiales bacterium]
MERIKVYSNERAGGQNKIFENIVLLYNDDFLADVGIVKVSENSIQTLTHEFIKEENSLEKIDEDIKLDEAKGATWFAGLQSAKKAQKDIRSDMASWQKFIETVSENFHKNFSLLEYAPISTSVTEEDIKLDKKLISNLIYALTDEKDFVVEKKKLDYGKEDIYGASLRMQLTDGVGEATPVLSRIFFRNIDGEMGIAPVKSSEAHKVNELLGVFDGLDSNKETSISSEKTVPAIMNSLKDLFSNPSGFQDYINLEDERDKNTVEAIRNRGAEGITTIYCRTIDVLGVFHVNWESRRYVVKMEDTEVFDVVFGVGNSITVKCSLCGEKLIENNRISPNNLENTFTIELELERLGLTEADFKLLLANNPFSSHGYFIQCKVDHISGGACQRRACDTSIFYVDKTGYDKDYPRDQIPEKLCKKCPYLEQVYLTNEDFYHTPQLVYCYDTMDLAPKHEAHECKNCGRTYSNDLDSRGFCEFCSSVMKGDSTKFKNMYKKYFEILPWSEKARYILAKIKGYANTFICHEDADLIMFKSDKNLLIYDKSSFDSKKPISYKKKSIS